MSIIDTAAHSVVSYDPKSSKAFTGQRLAKFTWKTVQDKTSAMYNVKRDSKCVSLPVIGEQEIVGNIVVLVPAVQAYLHSVQDKMIREMLEAGGNVVQVNSESINVAAIVEWLEQNDESGRITKESVGMWFDSTVAEQLAVVLADRLGVSEIPTNAESAKILATVEAFKGKIAALAGGKTAYEPKVCKSIISALELAGEGDVLAGRFKVRLNKMIADSIAGEELLALL